MKTLTCIFFISLSISIFSQDTQLSGPYLAQTPPGLIPQKFAPGIITTDSEHEGCSGFLLNQTVFIFQRYDEDNFDGFTTYEVVQKKGKWSTPKELQFLKRDYKMGDFTIAPDGQTIYFESALEIPGIKDQTGGNIFKVIRDENGWKTPEHLGLEVNTEYFESYPCVANDGTLYFFSMKPGGFGKSDLYTAELIDGNYTNVKNMGLNFNSVENEWDTYIAPNENYIIFCSTKDRANGLDNLYISYKNQDQIWTSPFNMGQIFNSDQSDNRPYVTQDGKYLFFTSMKDGTRDIYWIDAKIIEDLKPMELK